ncbi:MAG: hypothetical protein ACOYVK_07540 [Bacillota bacterium]
MKKLKRLEWIGLLIVLINLAVSLGISNEIKLTGLYQVIFNGLFAIGALTTLISFYIRKRYGERGKK